MPFKSKQQQKFMFARHPKIAKEWAEKTPNIKSLPKYANEAKVKGFVNSKKKKEKK